MPTLKFGGCELRSNRVAQQGQEFVRSCGLSVFFRPEDSMLFFLNVCDPIFICFGVT